MIATTSSLTITWLYATKMNIYGDRGNVIALQRRAAWRGIDVTIHESGIGDPIAEDTNIFFFGGGQDQAQIDVAMDLQGTKGDRIRKAVDAGASLLSVCGGYQLLGHEYRPHDAEPLPGIGMFDVVSTAGPERFIGNVVIESQWGELVGFENHSGLTFLGDGLSPMGKVLVGHGNNGRDGTEGAIYRNALGCYMHGALLPKNPALTDWLIEAGLRHRYGEVPLLAELDDRLELTAHSTADARARRTH
jgi:CobQ-like glutamine amidotransferase family enzyme